MLISISFLAWPAPRCDAQRPTRPFAVADDIELTHFYGLVEPVRFSPDGNYFVVYAERGRLDLNRVEDSLRFYRSQEIENFLAHPSESQPPSPVWVVNRSGKEGPIINQWRWLADSSGVAFLEGEGDFGDKRFVLANLREKTAESLTSATETVNAFDIRDRQHYVYTVANSAERERVREERQASAVVGTGRELVEIILPDDPLAIAMSRRSYRLSAVVGDRHFEVNHDGAPIIPYGNLGLSPDGGSLVTMLRVPDIPSSWGTLYPPPFAADPRRIRAGGSVRQYVSIDLRTGSIRPLTDAPASADAGLWAYAAENPVWSSDGQEILLPGTFLKIKDNVPPRPCVAVVDLPSNTSGCVEMLKGRTETGYEEGYHTIYGAEFAGGDKQRVLVRFLSHLDQSYRTTLYRHKADGSWQVAEQVNGIPELGPGGLEVTVKQGLNEPPALVATNKQTSRVVWDPNPQLKNIELGEASVYTWKDKEGRDWRGGLYKPLSYTPGQRYPLVIQTHGFEESQFLPSGLFPTAFAARALAAVGIAVLQVGEGNCPKQELNEGPCAVSGYEAAANQLVAERVADPDKIGIIGFSRSCFYVMETLTIDSSLHIKAASITDGVIQSYSQYLLYGNKEMESVNGGKPFGKGLQQWFKRSPGFNLEKIIAPLLVVGEGPASVLLMWEPYAGLRLLHKPVDLIMLNTDEHSLTNPAVRMASQGGSVDWFRFWLKGEEDSDPAKAEQYKRWRELRKLQEQNARQLQQANLPPVH